MLVEGALFDVRVRRLIGVGGDATESGWGLRWLLLLLLLWKVVGFLKKKTGGNRENGQSIDQKEEEE